MKQEFKLDALYRIAGEDGEFLEIAEDCEIPGLISLRWRNNDGEELSSLSFPAEWYHKVMEGIERVGHDLYPSQDHKP